MRDIIRHLCRHLHSINPGAIAGIFWNPAWLFPATPLLEESVNKTLEAMKCLGAEIDKRDSQAVRIHSTDDPLDDQGSLPIGRRQRQPDDVRTERNDLSRLLDSVDTLNRRREYAGKRTKTHTLFFLLAGPDVKFILALLPKCNRLKGLNVEAHRAPRVVSFFGYHAEEKAHTDRSPAAHRRGRPNLLVPRRRRDQTRHRDGRSERVHSWVGVLSRAQEGESARPRRASASSREGPRNRGPDLWLHQHPRGLNREACRERARGRGRSSNLLHDRRGPGPQEDRLDPERRGRALAARRWVVSDRDQGNAVPRPVSRPVRLGPDAPGPARRDSAPGEETENRTDRARRRAPADRP